MQIKGTDARFSIEQPDGSWQPIAIDSVTITREEDLNKERVPIPIQRGVTFEIYFKPDKPPISLKHILDYYVSIYEALTRKKCPGSWKTKRLQKKRLRSLQAYFSPLDPSAAV